MLEAKQLMAGMEQKRLPNSICGVTSMRHKTDQKHFSKEAAGLFS